MLEGWRYSRYSVPTAYNRTFMATKSRPLSLRLSERSYAYVEEEAQRAGHSKSVVVASLAEEGLRMRLFPGIAFREGRPRRAWVIGTGLDVWEIIEARADFGSTERMIAESDLMEAPARLADAYYERYPEEIDALVARNRRSLDEWRELYPTVEVIELDS